MLYVLSNLHWFLLLLGVLITFHELGHFLVAKACGVRVLNFSIGFGPALLSWRDRTTQYSLRLLPLGGYVQMYGESLFDTSKDLDKRFSFIDKALWQRVAIVAAGPIFNFILALVIYFILALHSTEEIDARIGMMMPDAPAARAGILPGDRIVAVNGQRVDNWFNFRQTIVAMPQRRILLDYQRNGQRHSSWIDTQAVTQKNIFQEDEKQGRIGVTAYYTEPYIAVLDNKSPAALAQLQTGDRLLAIGRSADDLLAVQAWHEVRMYLQSLPEHSEIFYLKVQRGEKIWQTQLTLQAFPNDLQEFAVQGNAFFISHLLSSADTVDGYSGLISQEVLIDRIEPQTPAEQAHLKKGDRLLAIAGNDATGQMVAHAIHVWSLDLVGSLELHGALKIWIQRGHQIEAFDITMDEQLDVDALKNETPKIVFGAYNRFDLVKPYIKYAQRSFLQAISLSWEQFMMDSTVILGGLKRLFDGRISMNKVSGPMMMFVVAEKTAKMGWEQFVQTMAMISVNLGLMNLLPIPVLDGGHLLFFAIEGLTRRKPSMRVYEIANGIGFALLLFFMMMSFRNDLMAFVFS